LEILIQVLKPREPKVNKDNKDSKDLLETMAQTDLRQEYIIITGG
jgi:hypothetical protein